MPEDAGILAGLHGLREAGAGLPSLAAGFLIGLVLVTLPAAIFGLTRRLRPAAQGGLEQRVIAARTLPPPERAAALAGLAREVAGEGDGSWSARAARRLRLDPQTLEHLRAALYRPGAVPDPAALDAALLRAARRMRG